MSQIDLKGLCIITSLVLVGCVPQAFQQSDFRSHLTVEEKRLLKSGQTVDKVHVSYWRFTPQQLYWQGPLRVRASKDNKLAFTPYGEWIQFRKLGDLFCKWTYTGIGKEFFSEAYFPDGSIDSKSYTVPAVLDGDSVRDTRLVYFVFGSPADTLAVNHWLTKNGKSLHRDFWSYDAAGKRPVPKGWKFRRH